MDERPFYPHSFREAELTGSIDRYKESSAANMDCRQAIDNIIKSNYDGYRLGKDLAKQIISEYGIDRTAYVIANSIQLKDTDGRISRENKAWAKEIFIPDEKHSRFMYLIEAHSGLLDLFANQYRREYKALYLWDKSQVIPPQGLDFTNKIMVLKLEILNEQHKTRDEQLFYPFGGFGCDSEKGNKKVMGEFLVDGERTNFYRFDFLGEAKPEFLPDWAKEKLAQKHEQSAQAGKDLIKAKQEFITSVVNGKDKEKPSVLNQLKANKEQSKQDKQISTKEKKQDKGER